MLRLNSELLCSFSLTITAKKTCITEQHFPPPALIEAVINTPNGSKLHTKVTTKTKDEDFSISWPDLLHSGCTNCVGRFACNTNKQKKKSPLVNGTG